MDELELPPHCIRLQPQLFGVFYWDFMQSYEVEGTQYMLCRKTLLEKKTKQLKSRFLAYLYHIYTSTY